MADEYDYTRQWSGVFVPREEYDQSGVYVLNDEVDTGRNTPIYDEETRILYDDVHPRNSPGGRRYPGPYGAGRASDKNGPSPAEREAAAYWRDVGAKNRYGREKFTSPSFAEERAQYIQGSRRYGHPGPRGMVTSARENRAAVDAVTWDNRPPHYAPETPNEYAHLFPADRGPAITTRDLVYPGFRQLDRFTGGGCAHRQTTEILKIVLLFILVSIVSYLVAEWRIAKKIGPPAGVTAGPIT